MRKNIQTAYAKINLSLDILGRLENGYHIVKMVMQTIDLSDELIFETQEKRSTGKPHASEIFPCFSANCERLTSRSGT